MAVKQITPMSSVREYLEKEIQRREAAILNTMAYVGESCLRAARELNTYIDRTGNLRSSTGYAIVKDGKVWTKSSFRQENSTGRHPAGTAFDGGSKGEEYLLSVISEFPKGIVLVLVAGMNYARFVQDYGYDVLDSAELLAERLVPQLMRQLGFSIK